MPTTKRGPWTTNASGNTGQLGLTKSGASGSINQSAGTTYVMSRRMCTPAALSSGSTAGATLDWVMGQGKNSGSAQNQRVYAFVTAGATDTVRGVLLDADGGTIPNTAAGVAQTGVALATVSVSTGDYMIFEWGFHVLTGSGTLNNPLYYGGTGTTDLFDGNTNVTVNPGWIDFNGMDWWFSAATRPKLSPAPKTVGVTLSANRSANW